MSALTDALESLGFLVCFVAPMLVGLAYLMLRPPRPPDDGPNGGA